MALKSIVVLEIFAANAAPFTSVIMFEFDVICCSYFTVKSFPTVPGNELISPLSAVALHVIVFSCYIGSGIF